MFHYRLFFIVMIPLLMGCLGASADIDVRTVLAGKIIRALAVDAFTPGRILVGQKGGKPGSAFVSESLDYGETWYDLNQGKPLSAEATDVQAVAAIGNSTVLAGTWKQGLFVSRDGGHRFSKDMKFPSDDIRSFFVRRGAKGAVVYAATARGGVFRSKGLARTWLPLGPGEDFLWSLSGSKDAKFVFAASPENAVYRMRWGRSVWTKIFDRDGVYVLSSNASGIQLALAAQSGAYLSSDAGSTWRPVDALIGEKLSAAQFFAGSLYFGSWSNGLIRMNLTSGKLERFFSDTPIVHIAILKNLVLLGTWGDGLMIVPHAALLQ